MVLVSVSLLETQLRKLTEVDILYTGSVFHFVAVFVVVVPVILLLLLLSVVSILLLFGRFVSFWLRQT